MLTRPFTIRLTKPLKKKLTSAGRATGLKEADIVRIAVDKFLSSNSHDELVQEVILHKTAAIRK